MRLKIALIGVLMCLIAAPGNAVVFDFREGNLAASADFRIVNGDLQVTLTNTSTYDVTNPAGVLTALFFSIAGDPNLTAQTIALGTGSSLYLNGSLIDGTDLSGQWVYNPDLLGAPNGATQGISSVGFSLFGPNSPNQFFDPPQYENAPNGLSYGILSRGDNFATYNGGIRDNPLIYNSVIFTLGLPDDFIFTDRMIGSNVTFQFGTDLSEPSVRVPEPGTMVLLGIGLIGMAGWGRKRFRE